VVNSVTITKYIPEGNLAKNDGKIKERKRIQKLQAAT